MYDIKDNRQEPGNGTISWIRPCSGLPDNYHWPVHMSIFVFSEAITYTHLIQSFLKQTFIQVSHWKNTSKYRCVRPCIRQPLAIPRGFCIGLFRAKHSHPELNPPLVVHLCTNQVKALGYRTTFRTYSVL